MTCEFWTHWIPIPGQAERLAGQAEERASTGRSSRTARTWPVTR
jgi:hypothetical protein